MPFGLYTGEDQWNDLVGIAPEPEPQAAPAPAPEQQAAPAPVEPGMYEEPYVAPGQYAEQAPAPAAPAEQYYAPAEPGMYEEPYVAPGQYAEQAPAPAPVEGASAYYGGEVAPEGQGAQTQAYTNPDYISTTHPASGAPVTDIRSVSTGQTVQAENYDDTSMYYSTEPLVAEPYPGASQRGAANLNPTPYTGETRQNFPAAPEPPPDAASTYYGGRGGGLDMQPGTWRTDEIHPADDYYAAQEEANRQQHGERPVWEVAGDAVGPIARGTADLAGTVTGFNRGQPPPVYHTGDLTPPVEADIHGERPVWEPVMDAARNIWSASEGPRNIAGTVTGVEKPGDVPLPAVEDVYNALDASTPRFTPPSLSTPPAPTSPQPGPGGPMTDAMRRAADLAGVRAPEQSSGEWRDRIWEQSGAWGGPTSGDQVVDAAAAAAATAGEKAADFDPSGIMALKDLIGSYFPDMPWEQGGGDQARAAADQAPYTGRTQYLTPSGEITGDRNEAGLGGGEALRIDVIQPQDDGGFKRIPVTASPESYRQASDEIVNGMIGANINDEEFEALASGGAFGDPAKLTPEQKQAWHDRLVGKQTLVPAEWADIAAGTAKSGGDNAGTEVAESDRAAIEAAIATGDTDAVIAAVESAKTGTKQNTGTSGKVTTDVDNRGNVTSSGSSGGGGGKTYYPSDNGSYRRSYSGGSRSGGGGSSYRGGYDYDGGGYYDGGGSGSGGGAFDNPIFDHFKEVLGASNPEFLAAILDLGGRSDGKFSGAPGGQFSSRKGRSKSRSRKGSSRSGTSMRSSGRSGRTAKKVAN